MTILIFFQKILKKQPQTLKINKRTVSNKNAQARFFSKKEHVHLFDSQEKCHNYKSFIYYHKRSDIKYVCSFSVVTWSQSPTLGPSIPFIK